MEGNVKRRLILLVSGLLVVGLTFGMSYMQKASATVPGTNQLISQDSSGTYANGKSENVAISGDGRYVAFESYATNLVTGGTNGYRNVFVKDTSTGSVVLASVNWVAGTQFTYDNSLRDISYNGRYVVFTYGGSGLLAVRDLVNNTTTPVCQPALGCSSYGMQGGAISADGRYVTYTSQSYPGLSYQAMLTDMTTNTAKVISVDSSGTIGNGGSSPGDISCDGGTITFYSGSSNLPGGSGGYIANIGLNGNVNLTHISYVTQPTKLSCNGNILLTSYSSSIGEYNRLTGQATTISYISWPTYTIVGMGISDDGRYVTYATSASQSTTPSYPSTGASIYQDVYLYDMKTSTRQLISFTTAGNRSGLVKSTAIALSDDGSKVAYTYQTPTTTDTTHELVSGVTTGTASTQDDVYTSLTGL
jgi:hypothetical protein